MYNFQLYVFLPLIYKLVAATELHPLSDEFIGFINQQAQWKASRNFHPNTSMSYIKQLMGTQLGHPAFYALPKVEHDTELTSLPETFDSREKWPNCPSMNEIRDQAECGSCWALGAVSAMTDRICTYSNGAKNFHFSAEDLLTCSGAGDCTNGGIPAAAWDYWVKKGLVSGGNYGSNEGCRPYSLRTCEHGVKGNKPQCAETKPTPPCKTKCLDGFKLPYEKDKRHGKNAYSIQGEEQIMAELYKNGPLEISFEVFADFLHYRGGVYNHVSGELIGGHAVKLMGWGEEGGQKYWLIANSWNADWGSNGYFKILRGVNECNIEKEAVGGEPALEEY